MPQKCCHTSGRYSSEYLTRLAPRETSSSLTASFFRLATEEVEVDRSAAHHGKELILEISTKEKNTDFEHAHVETS